MIKPTLDFFGHFNVQTISLLSSVTVFAMAFVSLIEAALLKMRIKWKISLYLAIGSVGGGIIGQFSFKYVVKELANNELVTTIQAITLALLMVFIFLFVKNKHRLTTFQVKNVVVIVSTGIVLGMLSSFLGIGGGPLNVPILAMLFSLKTKDAALNSVFIIFFSQLASLTSIGVSSGFANYDITMLPYMVIGGILGGFLGTKMAHICSDRQIDLVFMIVIICIFLMNVANSLKYFFA